MQRRRDGLEGNDWGTEITIHLWAREEESRVVRYRNIWWKLIFQVDYKF